MTFIDKSEMSFPLQAKKSSR